MAAVFEEEILNPNLSVSEQLDRVINAKPAQLDTLSATQLQLLAQQFTDATLPPDMQTQAAIQASRLEVRATLKRDRAASVVDLGVSQSDAITAAMHLSNTELQDACRILRTSLMHTDTTAQPPVKARIANVCPVR